MSTNCKTLSEYVPQLKFVKTLHILSSSVHNIIKSFKEPAEISVDKGQSRNQYWIPVIFGPSGYTALKTEKCLGNTSLTLPVLRQSGKLFSVKTNQKFNVFLENMHPLD